MTERPTVKVACKNVNGMFIQRWMAGYDDGTGVKHPVRNGAAIRLNGASALASGSGNPSSSHEPGITEVDEAWMREWLAENAKNPFVAEGFIYIVGEEKKDEASTA